MLLLIFPQFGGDEDPMYLRAEAIGLTKVRSEWMAVTAAPP